jgi:hypothetical protein
MSERDGEERGLRRRLGRLSTLQQRFEESRIGEVLISILVVFVVAVGVAFNLPESPIQRALSPVVDPAATATYLNQHWALFAPTVPARTETIEVQVLMADGSVRVWTVEPEDPMAGPISVARWKRLASFAVTNPEVRPGISRWAARHLTQSSEHPVRVAMVLRVQNLAAPGEKAAGGTAAKVLFQEELAGRP